MGKEKGGGGNKGEKKKGEAWGNEGRGSPWT